MSRVQIAVTFMDDSERFYPVPEDKGWHLSNDFGIPVLIIGGLPPRVEIPLSNVRTWEILPLGGGPATPDPSEVDRVVEWAERRAQGSPSCPASVTQRGLRWQCESPAGHHPADGHLNGSGELVWYGTPRDETRA